MKKYSNEELAIIDKLKRKYGVSKRFITMSINGDRTSETSDAILKDYKSLKKKVANALS